VKGRRSGKGRGSKSERERFASLALDAPEYDDITIIV